MNLRNNLKEEYNPLYFLASLGAGGLSASIYMYLMFMIKHPKTPMTTFEEIYPVLISGSIASLFVVIALFGIVLFAYLHFRLLFWNIKEYKLFKKTQSYKTLKTTNNEVSLMAMPLTFAMTINVCFVLGATFVPKLWSIVEFMFPAAILGFIIVGLFGLKIYGEFIARVITVGGFDFEKNSNFAQMLAAFAFAMVSVGLAAPGAMSHYIGVSAVALFFSIFFMVIAIIVVLKSMFLGFKSMYRYGVNKEVAVSLWMVLPISTLLGIAFIRISFGLVHNFEDPVSFPSLFMLSAAIVSLQLITGIFGYTIMKKINYFNEYLYSDKKSIPSLGIICPGVAFFVFGMFFIFFGLIKNDVLTIFSIPYFIVLAPFLFIQYKTIRTYFLLLKKLLIQK